MTFRGTCKRLAVLLAVSTPVLGAAYAGFQRWMPLTEAEMAAFRGSNAGRGTFTSSCNAFQAIAGTPGNWSCLGDADGTPCDNCQTTTPITYADQGGAAPRFMKDGATQDCGHSTTSGSATCRGQVCVGSAWGVFFCSDPKTPVSQ